MCSLERITIDFVFRVLKNRSPFIYYVKDKYLRLGLGVLRECDDKEISLFNNYHEELDKIKKRGFKPTIKEVQKLNHYLSEIVAEDSRDNTLSSADYKHLLWDFLSKLNAKEQQDLILQVLDYN